MTVADYTASNGTRWNVRQTWAVWIATSGSYEPGNFIAEGATREDCIHEIEEHVLERLESTDTYPAEPWKCLAPEGLDTLGDRDRDQSATGPSMEEERSARGLDEEQGIHRSF